MGAKIVEISEIYNKNFNIFPNASYFSEDVSFDTPLYADDVN